MNEAIRRKFVVNVWNRKGTEDYRVPCEVEVEVDLTGLALALGGRAVRSKGGKAVEAGGLVVVRRVK